LGYGADKYGENLNDSVVFNLNGNQSTVGANIHILAGYYGYQNNPITGRTSADVKTYFEGYDAISKARDIGKGFGGNITFDYTEFWMPLGSATSGYAEIRTPNGNIWGKDSLVFHGKNGSLTVDAGLGSVDDHSAILWSDDGEYVFAPTCSQTNILNTAVPVFCDDSYSWRTGNIMLKGGHLSFDDGTGANPLSGNATFRTREGFIDVYDAFTVDSMAGTLLLYAGMDNLASGRSNNFGDLSMRDFKYNPTPASGGAFFAADDNIMLNYGNSNYYYTAYGNGTPPQHVYGNYNTNAIYPATGNPYYYTSFEGYIDNLRYATYNVNVDGYLFYKHNPARRSLHAMYRGCNPGNACSPATGVCETSDNGARDLYFNFNEDESGTPITNGGLAVVAGNYIDMFTNFIFWGGTVNNGLGSVPGMSSLHGESVSGYALYIKSQYNGTGENRPEDRRATCELCQKTMPDNSNNYEMTYIGFHDDARIHVQNQKALLDAPVVEFFGHAHLDVNTDKGSKTQLSVRGDSLIFHDSMIIDGDPSLIRFVPFTSDAATRAKMPYGVVNDYNNDNYKVNYSEENPVSNGKAISMDDRHQPVFELGYQRCQEPPTGSQTSTNAKDAPSVGGDIIVAFKNGYKMPIQNTVVANHARISFVKDDKDGVTGGEWWPSYICTDLLRIRNKVEFYSDNARNSSGRFLLESLDQIEETYAADSYVAGMYTRHLHMEPGSELSIPMEDSLVIGKGTVAGGYGEIHENILVKVDGVLAPGYASLMESDCMTPDFQGSLSVHNLRMEKDAELRVSIGNRNPGGIGTAAYRTDTLFVNDELFFMGQIPVRVLTEEPEIPEGCYLFMVYGDKDGESKEYVKNLWLTTTRYNDTWFTLDYTKPGEVYLCVAKAPETTWERPVKLPKVEGVTYTEIIANGQQKEPKEGVYYIFGHQDITFTVKFDGAPRQVTAVCGYYPYQVIVLDQEAVRLPDGSLQFTLHQIVAPWNIEFGAPGSYTSNAEIAGQKIWSYRNTLYINVPKEDVVSVYNITGALHKRQIATEGLTTLPLDRGIYMVTLKDGTVYKVVVK